MRACDYNVYTIKYETTFKERTYDSGGECTGFTGRSITERREYLCVAPTESFAITAFSRYHSGDRIIDLTKSKNLDDLVLMP